MKTFLPFSAVSQRGRIFLTSFLLLPWHGFGQLPVLPFRAPGVRITSPANHATFYAPGDIPIFAYAGQIYALNEPINQSIGLTVTNVEFFAGTNELGAGFNLGSTVLPLRFKILRPRNLFTIFTWTANVQPGLQPLGREYREKILSRHPGAGTGS